MRNAGSSCYINASLQALLALESVRDVCRKVYENLTEDVKKALRKDTYFGRSTAEDDVSALLIQRALLAQPSVRKYDGDLLLSGVWRECAERSRGRERKGADPIHPHLLLRKAFWTCGRQEDAHEFLKAFMDGPQSEASRLKNLFACYMVQQQRCPACCAVRKLSMHVLITIAACFIAVKLASCKTI